jgi:hypothetical protein
VRLTRLWFGPVTTIANQPPKAVPGRQGLAIAAIIRNEARHLTEWLRYHAYAGVSAFYLYDDGSTDGSAEIARAALPDGQVTVLPWNLRIANARSGRGLNAQSFAMAHAVSNFGGQFRWMAMIDPDEFMVPMQHLTLSAALDELAAFPVIALPWVMFGRNGHATPPAGGVLRNFRLRARDLRLTSAPGVYNTKPVFDATRNTQVHLHRIRADGSRLMWNDKGEPFRVWIAPKPKMQSNALIQLNHYYTRSDAELQEKLAKGGSFTNRAPYRPDIVMRRVQAIEADVVEDSAILDFIARKDRETGEDFFAALTA